MKKINGIFASLIAAALAGCSAEDSNDPIYRHFLAQSGGCSICAASAVDNVAHVKELLDGGADPDTRQSGGPGRTALMFASLRGSAKVVKVLLAAGADVNAVDNADWTALMSAVFNKKPKVVKILLSAGADVNAVDDDDRTALNIAKYYERYEIIPLLEAAGAK